MNMKRESERGEGGLTERERLERRETETDRETDRQTDTGRQQRLREIEKRERQTQKHSGEGETAETERHCEKLNRETERQR